MQSPRPYPSHGWPPPPPWQQPPRPRLPIWMWIVVGVAGVAFVGFGVVRGRQEAASHPDAVPQPAARAAASQASGNTTTPSRDSAATTPRSAAGPSAMDASAFEALRVVLLKLSTNPLAAKPTKVHPPDQDEPDHTTYEYSIDGLGDVIQWRMSPASWSLMLLGKTSPEYFVPASGLRSLVAPRTVSWWRVTDGPFRGGFVVRTPGGIEVRSREHVCRVRGSLPSVAAECARE